MADVSIKYKGVETSTLDASGRRTLRTAGKYCEADIVVEYTTPEKPTQSKSATPSLTTQTILPDTGKLLSQVDVGAVTKELLNTLDADFVAGNIKKDVELFGLRGTAEVGGSGGDYNVESIDNGDGTQDIHITDAEGGGGEPYEGDYTVEPSFETQTLATKNKRMLDDVTVNPIEVSRTSNPQGGTTIYILGVLNNAEFL